MSGGGRRSGRWPRWVLAAALSLILFTIAGCQTNGIRDLEGSSWFPPQPDQRFINVGSAKRGQFTENEFRFLAENFDYVLLTKFHGGFDIGLHHEAARRLKELNPAVRVFPYLSMKYWFKQNDRWGGQPLDPAWYLRDNEGNIVYRSRERDNDHPENVAYVDLANPEYRQWALDTLRAWLEAAPYDGIFFDAAEPIADYGAEDRDEWLRRLGQRRIEEYNAGIQTLLAGAQQVVGPDREVIFNGIAPHPRGEADRNLNLLQVADGALNERFCLDARGRVHPLQDDLDLMRRYDDRQLFLRTSYPHKLSQDDRERYGRFCLGSFLLGWRPGLTYFQFGDDYTADQLRGDIAAMNIPVGTPAGPYRRTGDVFSRSFANGEVYVNTGDRSAQVTLPRALTSVQAENDLAPLEAGLTITVPPQDAVFLLSPDALAALNRTS